MAGILFFGVIGLWIWFSIVMGRKLPKWFKIEKHKFLATLGFTALMIALPWADEIAGRADFAYYCNKYADVIVAEGEGDPSGDYKMESLSIYMKSPFLPEIDAIVRKIIDSSSGKEVQVSLDVWQGGGWIVRNVFEGRIRSECSGEERKKQSMTYNHWADKIKTDRATYRSTEISRAVSNLKCNTLPNR